MQRVSSRQRLVSWDAFDANVDGSLHSNDTYYSITEEDHHLNVSPCSTEDSTLKRKRMTSKLPAFVLATTALTCVPGESPGEFHEATDDVHGVHVVPHQDEGWQAERPMAVATVPLPQDLLLNVLQFLDVTTLHTVAQVSRSHHKLLQTVEAAEAIWKPALCRKYTWLSQHGKTLTTTQGNGNKQFTSATDYALLLQLATATPTKVDDTLFAPRRWSRSLHTYRTTRPTQLRLLDDTQHGATVQFVAQVGSGDRCIRADQPLPHPRMLEARTLPLLRRVRSAMCRTFKKEVEFLPFVAPYLSHGCLQLEPRLISYFEVDVLPAEALPTIPQRRSRRRTITPDCVAVGLATDQFSLHTRMPGWDKASFGFHGDDGGIFHAAGSMLQQLTESGFGANDVIGCGVDYVHRKIFYTRNGVFLGHAFGVLDESHLQAALYPVVGLDTNCPVRCNFGTDREFVFDLHTMVQKQRDVVERILQQK